MMVATFVGFIVFLGLGRAIRIGSGILGLESVLFASCYIAKARNSSSQEHRIFASSHDAALARCPEQDGDRSILSRAYAQRRMPNFRLMPKHGPPRRRRGRSPVVKRHGAPSRPQQKKLQILKTATQLYITLQRLLVPCKPTLNPKP